MVKSKKETPSKRKNFKLCKKTGTKSKRGRPLKPRVEANNKIFSFEEYLKDTSLLMTLDEFSLIPSAILNYLNRFPKEEREEKYSAWLKPDLPYSKVGEFKENPYKKENEKYCYELFNFLKNMLEFTHQNLKFQNDAKTVMYEIMSCFCNCSNKTSEPNDPKEINQLIGNIWEILTINEIEGKKFKDKFSGRQDSVFKEIVEALGSWKNVFDELYPN